MTRPTRFTHLLSVSLGAFLLLGWSSHVDPMRLTAASKLWFEGTSTVRDWSCNATRLDAVVDAEADAPRAVVAGRKAVESVRLTVPVASLDCNGNSTMNGHMWKALNAEQHQRIEFVLSGYELATAPSRGTLTGTLSINGSPRPITLPVEFAVADNVLKVTGSYALKMTEWGVEPPKLMFGALKVAETVTVRFELLLQH